MKSNLYSRPNVSIVNLIVTLIFAFLIYTPPTFAADLSSCADDLDRLRRAARDASDKANEAKSSEDNLQNCRSYRSDEYNICDFESSSYRNSLNDLDGELSTVESRIRSVSSSCGSDLSRVSLDLGSKPNSYQQNNMCNVYLKYKGQMPKDTLLKACLTYMTIEDCNKCLSK